jgi:hypothetical protein
MLGSPSTAGVSVFPSLLPLVHFCFGRIMPLRRPVPGVQAGGVGRPSLMTTHVGARYRRVTRFNLGRALLAEWRNPEWLHEFVPEELRFWAACFSELSKAPGVASPTMLQTGESFPFPILLFTACIGWESVVSTSWLSR